MTLAACDDFSHIEFMFGQEPYTSHFSLLKALHSADVEALLPAAYHTCADYDMDVLCENATSLGPECFRTLVRGKTKLTYDLNELIATVPGILIKQSGAYDCHKERNGVRFNDLDGFINMAAIKCVEGSILVGNCVDGLCTKCQGKLTKLINERREQIWEAVPSYFGFPGWDVCRAKLNAILTSEDDA